MRNGKLRARASVIAFIATFGCAHTATTAHADGGVAQAATAQGINTGFAFAGSFSLPDVVARVLPSVVSISSTRVSREVPSMFPFGDPFFHHFFGPENMRPREYKEHGLGSGVVVQPNVILTNNHVIEGAEEIKVTTSDKQVFSAKVVGADPKSDLAVLRLEGTSSRLKPIVWGDSAPLRLGDFVLAIGNPFGVGETVTSGIVSAMGRTGLGILDYENFIQTDAAINPGNSGGALVNSKGELIGINTAILSRSGGYQGVGFAIPSNTAKPIMDSLLKSGKVVRGWLGVGIQDLTADLAQALKLPDASGVLVSSIQPNTPAAKAGLRRGDVILKVNNESVDSTGKLRNLIASDGAGTKITLQVRRDSRIENISLTLGELPGSLASNAEHGESGAAMPGSVAGLALEPLTPALRDKYNIPKDVPNGVVVTGVESQSKAERAGVKTGDVVLEVNRKSVTTVEQFKTEWARNQNQAVLLVQRDDSTVFIVIQK